MQRIVTLIAETAGLNWQISQLGGGYLPTKPSKSLIARFEGCLMNDEPLFSVVIPVLNGGSAFAVCLAALRRSRFADWELIVVDDGSCDDSAEMAQSHGATILNTPQAGPAHARNVGAQAARGRYLFFLDADCEVHEDTLWKSAEILQADPSLDAL
ncbi:MAG: glycosyltransferase family 2 protein, partial [Candidatus Promineifilaceae bacterium]